MAFFISLASFSTVHVLSVGQSGKNYNDYYVDDNDNNDDAVLKCTLHC